MALSSSTVLVLSRSGNYSVRIWYLNGDAVRYAYLSVNGGLGMPVSFPSTGSFETLGSIQITVALNTGCNTLKFYNPIVGSWAPDFDRIEFNNCPTCPTPTSQHLRLRRRRRQRQRQHRRRRGAILISPQRKGAMRLVFLLPALEIRGSVGVRSLSIPSAPSIPVRAVERWR